MPLWVLTPVDLADPNWEASSYRGPVMVRAPNAQKARAVAARTFDVKTGFKPGQGLRFPPWRRAALVTVARVHDPRFEPEGATEVLEPSL
jgi:hypothetical protein